MDQGITKIEEHILIGSLMDQGIIEIQEHILIGSLMDQGYYPIMIFVRECVRTMNLKILRS